MNRIKMTISVAMILLTLFAQVGSVFAAPPQQTTPITGTVTQVACETDATTLVNTFLVTIQATDGTSQTVRVSQQTAIDLGLVTPDAGNIVDCASPSVVDELANPPATEVTIDPSAVIVDPAEEEDVHPISALLASFFDTDAGEIDTFHDDGFGFGVIAQALWISRNLTGGDAGDAALAGEILTAKQDKDFAFFFETHPEYLAEGETAPSNWGQFKKLLSNKKNNLGSVVSGNADTSEGNGNGNGQGNGNNGNGQGNGNGNNGNGQGNGNGNNGNGHGNGNGNNNP